MYVGCSGETYVYACCILGKVHICGKNVFLALGFAKGMKIMHREMEKGLFCKMSYGEANISITYNLT
jgi:hypothetical protein